jgi:hypothetical protein
LAGAAGFASCAKLLAPDVAKIAAAINAARRSLFIARSWKLNRTTNCNRHGKPVPAFGHALDGFVGLLRLSLHHAGGDEALAAALENYAGQRPRWRAGDHGAVGGRKFALVAGTKEEICFGMVEHSARSVRAGAAEGQERVLRRVDQDARLDVRGIGENFRAAYWNFRSLCDDARGIFFRQSAEECPRSRGQADERGPNEKRDYLPARCGGIFLDGDGESFPVR